MDEQPSEKNKMRSADDMALEMQGLCWELADKRSLSNNWKDRISAVSRAISVNWSRAKDLYYQDAKIIKAEELENARIVTARLREEATARKNAEHVAWLREQIDRHRASGEELRGPHVDALEHLLRVAGDPAGALAVSDTQEGSGR